MRQQDVFKFLRSFSPVKKFRIIFADPPYEKTESGESFTEKLLTNPALPRLLEPGGLFVLEKPPTEKVSKTKFWKLLRERKYGATEVLFLSAAAPADLATGRLRPIGGPDWQFRQSAIKS